MWQFWHRILRMVVTSSWKAFDWVATAVGAIAFLVFLFGQKIGMGMSRHWSWLPIGIVAVYFFLKAVYDERCEFEAQKNRQIAGLEGEIKSARMSIPELERQCVEELRGRCGELIESSFVNRHKGDVNRFRENVLDFLRNNFLDGDQLAEVIEGYFQNMTRRINRGWAVDRTREYLRGLQTRLSYKQVKIS